MKNIKIEQRGSLFTCKLYSGVYSDYSEESIIVNANNIEEAINIIKVLLSSKEKQKEYPYSFNS